MNHRINGMISTMQEGIGQELQSKTAVNIATDDATLQKYSRDASIFLLTPEAVAYPRSVDEIGKLVEFASQNPGTSLTARAGGSCMSGGSITNSIIVDTTKYLNRLIRINSEEATVQPGMFYADFEPKAAQHGALMPSYPASKNLAALGGLVSNNSGGEKTLAYGKTERYVKKIKVVLADGNEYEFHPLTKQELAEKLDLQTYEGELYRSIHKLLRDNRKLISQAKPNVSKNSTGYNLWNIEHDGLFDLTQLFVGAQGTLGIITEITFRLVKPRPHSRMLVLFLRDITNLADIVQAVLRHKPESFESYDNNTLKLALKFFPALLKQMKSKALFSLMLQFLPEVKALITGGLPQLVLIAEFTGFDEQEITKRTRAAEQSVRHMVSATHVTKSEAEAEKYWTIRRESFNLLRNKVKDKKTAPFIDDFIVRPEHLPEFLPKLEKILSKYDIFYTIAGHVGDGNFHIIPLMNLADEKQRAIIPELSEKVYDLVFQYKGSMSAEHNDGLVRGAYLEKMYGKKVFELFKQVKQLLDPKDIFNPGKKVEANMDFAMRHVAKQ